MFILHKAIGMYSLYEYINFVPFLKLRIGHLFVYTLIIPV